MVSIPLPEWVGGGGGGCGGAQSERAQPADVGGDGPARGQMIIGYGFSCICFMYRMTIQNGKHLLLTNYQESKRQVGFYCSYSVVQKKFTLFEIPASF